jgi:mycothiol synthase
MGLPMKLIMRSYQSEEDFWRIRNFLREVFLLNDRREHGWHVARIDYWRWHAVENCQACGPLDEVIFLWETDAGQLAAVLHPEEAGDVYLQVHPTYRSAELEEDMLACAEQRLAIQQGEKKLLHAWARSDDTLRAEVLTRRGYKKSGWGTHVWRRELDTPIPVVPVAEGYTIRSLGDVDEVPARSWASWRGFHPDEADEKYEDWQWYLNLQRCPLYRRDLDIVAIAPTGEIASFCTFWYDDVTRTAYIEPVATVPEHQRRGLSRAAITEGLRRVQRMGAVRAFVTGMEPGPNALYSSTLSAAHDRFEQWVKSWQP